MRVCGQEFDAGLIERISAAVGADAQLTRSGLSRRVCEWLDWRAPGGRLREVSCRKALLQLHREGRVSLPPAQPFAAASAQAADRGEVPEVRFAGALDQLGLVRLEVVRGGTMGSRIWRQLLRAHHPLGAGPLVGAQLRYLVHAETVGWVAALAFSAPAWQLRARDEWIGWDARARVCNLGRVINNSRFLIVPGIEVPNLASYVLARAARQLAVDWPRYYEQVPLLLETYVDEACHSGTSYRAANWLRLGTTAGRGRQDRHNRASAGVKAVYVLPLAADGRQRLCARAAGPALRTARAAPGGDWAEQEFGTVDLPDGRLRQRLLTVARDFMRQPQAPIVQACGGDAGRAKGAYRLFKNVQVDLDTLLQPHREATLGRVREQAVVLAVQDTTSLNYTAHPATDGLGPIARRADAALGMLLHDTLAFSVDGTPLGLLDVQCWVRQPEEAGKSARRKELPIEQKESIKWLRSLRQVAAAQALCPSTRLVSVGDREADVYELFLEAAQHPEGPALLVRADCERKRQVDQQQALWPYMAAQPGAALREVHIAGKGGAEMRKTRLAQVTVRYAAVTLQPPKRYTQPVSAWAVYALEEQPPAGAAPIEWMLLTTLPTDSAEQAVERLDWYARRWGIETYHRTLKSGCRIEDRRLGDASSLQACLAIDLVVAWRVFHLTKLGRDHPEAPYTAFFEPDHWETIHVARTGTLLPRHLTPPTVNQMMRWVAQLGGFLNQKSSGHPGATVLWRGLGRLDDITHGFRLARRVYGPCPSGP